MTRWRLEEWATSRLGIGQWLTVARFDTEREAKQAITHRQRTQGRNAAQMRAVAESGADD